MSFIVSHDAREALPILTCNECTKSGADLILFCDFCSAATMGALDEHNEGLLRSMSEIADVLALIAMRRKAGEYKTADDVNAFFTNRRKN